MLQPNKDAHSIENALRRLAPRVPSPVRCRLLNALENFERARRLFKIDREMASFRAITGEEESATALIKSVHLRRYPHSEELNPRSHIHKAAVMACVGAIATTMQPMLKEFQLIFDFDKARIDVKIPLSNFGVNGGDSVAIQPVEPLGLVFSRDGVEKNRLYNDALAKLAERSEFAGIKELISAAANGRNRLLYASDATLPFSEATAETLSVREKHGHTLIILACMVLQSREHLPTVCEAILAFLGVINRLPGLDEI